MTSTAGFMDWNIGDHGDRELNQVAEASRNERRRHRLLFFQFPLGCLRPKGRAPARQCN